MFWQLIIIALCFWLVKYNWNRRRIYKLYDKLPKLNHKAYPVIGHCHLFGLKNEDRMKFLVYLGRSAVKLGGLTSFWISIKLYVAVCDPVEAEAILKHCLDKDDNTMRHLRSFTGNGSIFAPVNIWRPRRKILAPIFSTKNLQRFVREFAKQATILTDQLEEQVGKSEVAMWNFFNTYTFDGICNNSLGVEINSQSNGYHPFLHAFEVLSKLIGYRVFSPWLYWDTIYDLSPDGQRVAYWKKVAYDFIDNLIDNKRKELAELKSRNESLEVKTFLDMLIESSGNEEGYTDIELREEIIVILSAGSDTSAVATSYTTVMLSRYPEVQEKVYQELQAVFENTGRPVTAADLPKLVYLEAVVKECLRLYPPVPIYVRDVFNDLKLPSGVTLVNGVAVVFNLVGMHRNPKYWGEDAEQFRPERFLEGPLKHPVQFIPFSYSMRNCLGGTYAMMSIKTALATILRRYRLLPPTSLDPQEIKKPLRLSFDIMMRHVDNYSLKLEYRNK